MAIPLAELIMSNVGPPGLAAHQILYSLPGVAPKRGHISRHKPRSRVRPRLIADWYVYNTI